LPCSSTDVSGMAMTDVGKDEIVRNRTPATGIPRSNATNAGTSGRRVVSAHLAIEF
jgi:hypothetical protein